MRGVGSPRELTYEGNNNEMEFKILEVKISLKKVIRKFGHELCQRMNHSGIPLYLILHPEEVDILSGAKPIGLEVNLPNLEEAIIGLDRLNKGRGLKRIDLIFEKGDTYYLVEVIDRKYITKSDKEKMIEYVKRFKELLSIREEYKQIVPIIVHPAEHSPTDAFAELMGLTDSLKRKCG